MNIAAVKEGQVPEYMDRGLPHKILHWFLRHKLAAVSLVVIVTLYVLGIFAEWIAPHDPLWQDFTASYQGPSWAHLLGTDALGRDYFSRVLFALRTTIGISAATIFVGAGFTGMFLGLLSAYRGGWVETAIMRAGEVSALFPELMFMILISATIGPRYHAFMDDVTAWEGPALVLRLAPIIFGIVAVSIVMATVATRRGFGWLVYCMGAVAFVLFGTVVLSWLINIEGFADFFLIFVVLLPFSWYGAALLVRSQVLSLREYDFVLAAKAMGATDTRIILQHLLPNVLGLVVYIMSLTFGAVAVAEMGLTYLGLGVQPPHPSFGSLIFEAGFIRTLEANPHLLLIPAAIVGLFLYSFSLLGEALSESVTLARRQ
ncbi:MAG: hypothetical protein A2806_02845 [Candidatus Terrybacteria bacterium RIFCSPHIGHO2_01_FULL_48_17]|uniref:Oligopeptide transport system permease protein OppC n=1 Tax=Candidatus Terrybacteria bacterium RIFCSPHIGHO2_01_FULL_48_17 TaxID=1802362 RepID=A0A1G2PLK8_9BACT|nr:MAG: hypothetical protein A2806_02845 [Candidatus Terrybacteria bacterium RIFCSPHIGHO2_01_FULL_48_17]OHA52575.1 MAG: hypothetical protein A3A30_00890 [Candidatus Terrybacteria bacterium RIFCSPLOWO2_01_FULL_48_14]